VTLNKNRPFIDDDSKSLATLQSEWITVGVIDATAGAADGALGVTERNFSTSGILANSVQELAIPPSWNSIEVQLESATDDENSVIDVYVGRALSDVAKRVCTLTCTTGTQTGDGSGLKLVDTITVTNEKWYSAITVLSGVANHAAGIMFDLQGYSKIMFHGHTTVDGDLTVKIAGI